LKNNVRKQQDIFMLVLYTMFIVLLLLWHYFMIVLSALCRLVFRLHYTCCILLKGSISLIIPQFDFSFFVGALLWLLGIVGNRKKKQTLSNKSGKWKKHSSSLDYTNACCVLLVTDKRRVQITTSP